MSEEEYQNWWKLHRRAALGEALTDGERTQYDEGLAQLHSETTLKLDEDTLRQTEEHIAQLEAEHQRLSAARDALLSRLERIKTKTPSANFASQT